MAYSFTKIYPKMAIYGAFLLACSFLTTASALAQIGFERTNQRKGDLPDSSQFYMSRRQIQYVDDSPVVKFSGGGGSVTPGGSGPIPAGGQMALPRAGFSSNINANAPSITTPLPKVNNGVPPKPTPAEEQAALRAKAASMKAAQAKAVAAAKPKPPPPVEGIKAYNSYKGYNPAASLAGASGSSGTSAASEGKVQGNILHWSRKRKGGQ